MPCRRIAISSGRQQSHASRSSQASVGRPLRLQVSSSIRARWSFDVRYGVKTEALVLVQEWVQGVGLSAGLTASSTRLNSGAIGAPESRIELESEFESLAHFEEFFVAIPQKAHKDWSERAQKYIIDGSPRWEVFRSASVVAENSAASASTILEAWGMREQSPPQATATGPTPPIQTAQIPQDTADSSISVGGLIVPDDENAQRLAQKIVLDWKGEPMVINPGDRLPM